MLHQEIRTTTTCTRCKLYTSTKQFGVVLVHWYKYALLKQKNTSQTYAKKKSCDKREWGRRWGRRKEEKKNLNGLAERFNLRSIADTRTERNDCSASVVSAWKRWSRRFHFLRIVARENIPTTKYYYFSLENL